MLNPQRVPEVLDYKSLNKFLMGTITGIKTKETTIEEADAISKIADKIVKNNLTAIMYMKAKNNELPLDFFEAVENQTLLAK